MMISDDRLDMMFRVELLMKSIKKFSKNSVHFSVVINSQKRAGLREMNYDPCLSPKTIDNKYISKNAEVFVTL